MTSRRDLKTFHGVTALYEMVDILAVDAHNARVWADHRDKE